MKTASSVVQKWQGRSGAAVADYEAGARSTTKDQAAAAIAALPRMKAGLDLAFSKGLVEKGLQKSGKGGWLAGVTEKGAQNFGTGVSAPKSASKYVENSGRYDSARGAAAGLPRGPKGSEQNYQRSVAVAKALRAAKVGA